MELTDLSLQPLMFVVLFAYVFGGAIAGSPKAYLQFGRHHLPERPVPDHEHRHGPEHRHHQGSVRPLPQPAHRPLGPAGRTRPTRGT